MEADEYNCLKCEAVPCVNLYTNEKNEKQELALLEEFSISLDINRSPPCLLGVCILALCKFLKLLWDCWKKRVRSKTPSTPFYLQAIKDLKASTLLLMTGHYKASMTILRGTLENFVVGLYFDYKALISDAERVVEAVRRYFRTKNYEVPNEDYQKLRGLKKKIRKTLSRDRFLWFDNLILYLKAEGVVAESTYSELRRLYEELNEYVHPKWFEDPNKGHPVCPAAVNFVEEDYEECIKKVQRAVALLIEAARGLYLERIIERDELAGALKYLVKIEDYEKVFGKKAVYYKRLKRILNEIRKSLV